MSCGGRGQEQEAHTPYDGSHVHKTANLIAYFLPCVPIQPSVDNYTNGSCRKSTVCLRANLGRSEQQKNVEGALKLLFSFAHIELWQAATLCSKLHRMPSSCALQWQHQYMTLFLSFQLHPLAGDPALHRLVDRLYLCLDLHSHLPLHSLVCSTRLDSVTSDLGFFQHFRL